MNATTNQPPRGVGVRTMRRIRAGVPVARPPEILIPPQVRSIEDLFGCVKATRHVSDEEIQAVLAGER